MPLIESDWPSFHDTFDPISVIPNRIEPLQALLDRHDYTHAVVYGDREHAANLLSLTGFDPRFEEALLIVGRGGKPLLLVGNECESYLPISPLYRAGQLRHQVYQPFSLQDQPRQTSRPLDAIFADEGIQSSSKIAAIGWKPYANPSHSDLPSYIIDTLRAITPIVTNETLWLTHPAHGLRTICSPAEIALFEANNTKASEAMKRIQFALRPGITDYELLAEAAHYDGSPLSCHMTLKTGPKRVSLASPSGHVIERGHSWSANIAYWGANICRANWVAAGAKDLPPAAQDYLAAFTEPYFAAMAKWLTSLTLGQNCGECCQQIQTDLPYETFKIFLNPGHHIHYDEWPGSPFYAGSNIALASGMVLQSDVIPSHPVYFSTRLEDGYALADAGLRATLAQLYPLAWQRIEARRFFLASRLNLHLPPELLPLSNTAGILAPWALSPNLIHVNA